MYLIVRTEKRSEPAYIFWTVMLSVFIITLSAMGLDYITFKVAIKSQEELIKSYLFRASFLSSSPSVAVFSWVLAVAFTFFIWRFGGVLKKIIVSFNISHEMLDEITYKSIAIGFPIFHPRRSDLRRDLGRPGLGEILDMGP